MFDIRRLSTIKNTYHYPLHAEGEPVSGYSAWAVFDDCPYYKTVGLFVQGPSVSLSMDEAEHLYDALGHFLAMNHKEVRGDV